MKDFQKVFLIIQLIKLNIIILIIRDIKVKKSKINNFIDSKENKKEIKNTSFIFHNKIPKYI